MVLCRNHKNTLLLPIFKQFLQSTITPFILNFVLTYDLETFLSIKVNFKPLNTASFSRSCVAQWLACRTSNLIEAGLTLDHAMLQFLKLRNVSRLSFVHSKPIIEIIIRLKRVFEKCALEKTVIQSCPEIQLRI